MMKYEIESDLINGLNFRNMTEKKNQQIKTYCRYWILALRSVMIFQVLYWLTIKPTTLYKGYLMLRQIYLNYLLIRNFAP